MTTVVDAHAPALIVSAVDLSRTFGEGEAAVDALKHVSVGFPAGGFTAIMGRRVPASRR